MRRRLLMAAVLLATLAGCGSHVANGAPPESAAPVASDGSFTEDGSGALAARAGASATAKGATTTAPAAGSGKAPAQTFATTSSQFTFTRAGRTLRTVVWYPKTAGRYPLVLWS